MPSVEISAPDHQDRRGGPADFDALLLHHIGKLRLNELELVLHLNLGDIRQDAGAEGERDSGAAGRRCRRHIGEVIEAGHAVLDDRRHRFLHGLRTCTIVRGTDADRRRRDIRILRNGQGEDRQDAAKHDDDGNDPGKNRALDKEMSHLDCALSELNS
ncbi:hypothetical protein QE369_003648 [Agrobacterium larrymoorei]|uniref:Uncharacterized protein n=1 Tax=Agrobacterium larrymoorei TaxID=160699 RepID=A0AAJ2ESU5_9HYPH|nr:hypothetical protein [Agrobacterium larrymoorei]